MHILVRLQFLSLLAQRVVVQAELACIMGCGYVKTTALPYFDTDIVSYELPT